MNKRLETKYLDECPISIVDSSIKIFNNCDLGFWEENDNIKIEDPDDPNYTIVSTRAYRYLLIDLKIA
jgi:hypothetical protein